MIKQRRKRRSADPDDIYRGAAIELPWILDDLAGSGTAWDREFSF
jgi:hypothetical protein